MVQKIKHGQDGVILSLNCTDRDPCPGHVSSSQVLTISHLKVKRRAIESVIDNLGAAVDVVNQC